MPGKRVLMVLLIGVFGNASTPTALAQELNVASQLTPRLQDLLRQEMVSIQAAGQEILAALVAGDDARVGRLAQQIHDSFILRQSMTAEDKQDLMAVVPEAFVQRDKAFHQLAAQLAQAARAGDRAAQHASFAEMIQACSGCHARYARDRFSAYVE